MLPAINDQELLDVLQDYMKAKDKMKPFHTNIEEWRNWYNFEHYLDRGIKKPGEERFNDPTPTNVVDLSVGIILAHPMEWKAQGLSPSAQEQEETSSLEKFISGTIEANSFREEYNINYETVMHQCRDGSMVVFSGWDDLLAGEYDQGPRPVPDPKSPQGVRMVQHYHNTPVRVQVIDPLKTFWLKGGPRRWGQVFRVERMSVKDVEDLYGVRLKNYAHYDDRTKREHEGELIDAWKWEKKFVDIPGPEGMGQFNQLLGQAEQDEKWVVRRGLLFDNEFIWEMRDTDYDDLPYTLGFFKPLDRDDPKLYSVGSIQPLQTTVIQLENSINRRSRQITLLSSLPIMTKAMPGRNIRIDSALGQHVNLQPDEDMAFPAWPGNAPDVQAHIDFLRGRLQQSGFSESTFGEGASAVSGYSLSQQTDQNRIRLEQPVVHLEMFWAHVAQKIMRLTSKYAPGASIRVFGKMKGKDFTESIIPPDFADFRISVKFKPEFPGEQQRKVAMAVQSKGTLSESTILERYYDIQQPDDEVDKIIMDMTIRHPLVIQYGIMKELQSLAEAGDEVAAMVLEQMQQQGPQDGGGGKPPGMEQLAGASPTGQATSQEQGNKPPGQGEGDTLSQMVNSAPGMGGGGG